MTITDWIEKTAEKYPHEYAVLEADEEGSIRRGADFSAVAAAIRAGRQRREQWRGRRVGLVGEDGVDFVLRGLAIMAAEACLFPIARSVRGAALEALVARVKLHGLVDGEGWTSCAAMESVDGQGDEIFRSLEPAFIRFTSGTTAASKGVVISRQAVVERVGAANKGLGIGPGDRILWLMPMAHHWVVSILLYLAHGACVMVSGGGSAGAMALARKQRATVVYATPHDYSLLADSCCPEDWAELRLAVSTAGPLTAGIAAEARRALGQPLVGALGVIEAGLVAMNRERALQKPLSVGRALPDYQLVLRDEAGKEIRAVGPDYSGQICVRGPGMFSAYLDPWRVFNNMEFATGDEAWRDGEGDWHIVGRRSNRIQTGGMKFFCEEVEAALALHPAVRACRVLAEPHPGKGEVPVAEIELVTGEKMPTEAEWKAFLETRIAPHMVPVAFTAVAAIPRTPTGKIQRW